MYLSLPLLLLLSQAGLGLALNIGRDINVKAVTSTSASTSTQKTSTKSSASPSTSTKTRRTKTKTKTSTSVRTSTSTKSTTSTSTKSTTSTSTKSTTSTSTKSTTSSTKSTSTTTSTKSNTSTTTTSSSSPNPTSQGKRGLAYNDPALTRLFKNPKMQLSWMYNWGQTTSNANQNLEFFPMLWNLDPSLTSTWDSNIHAAMSSGTTHVLGFNEPELTSQSHISPSDAADGWMKWMQPYAGTVKLGGPAISCAGLDWLQQFYGNCTRCHIDFQPIHWYDFAWNLGWFNAYVNDAHAISNRTIWVTEFQGWGNDTEQIQFFETVGQWMDDTDWIGGYAYFGVFNQSLVDLPPDGASGTPVLSDIGIDYQKFVSS